MSLLRDLAVRTIFELRRCGFPSLLTGGVALGILTKPRATSDVDIIVAANPDAAGDVVEAVEAAGFSVERRSVVIRRLKDLKPVKVGSKGRLHLDVRLAVAGLDADLFQRALTMHVGDVLLSVIPPEGLVAYKLARFDDQDRVDIKALMALPDFDRERLVSYAHILGADKPVVLERAREVLADVPARTRVRQRGASAKRKS